MKYLKAKLSIILLIPFLMVDISIVNAQPNNDSIWINREKNVDFGYNNSLPEWMVTRSISTIASTTLSNSISTNFGSFLHGKLAGLTVSQTNNEPGFDMRALNSRGIGTWAGTGMLILVDGFECSYEQMVPEEMESITLLKDAASTAMYGARGANGVLLITTKRGQEGPLKINFSAQTGIETPYRLPEFLGSYDYARLYNEALVNDQLPIQYQDAALNAYQTGSDPYFYPDVNWQEQVLRDIVPISKYNLSFSGGKNRARYFVYLGGVQQVGLYKKTEDLSENSINSKFAQHNFRTNVDIDLTSRLTASVNLEYAVSNKQNPFANQTDGVFNLISSLPPNAFPVYNPNGSYGGNALYTNPLADILETGFFTFNYRTSQTSLKLTYQLDMIAEGLSIATAASFNNRYRGYSSKSRSYERFSIIRDADTGEIEYNQFGNKTSLASNEGNYDISQYSDFQAYLVYKRNTENHFIDATLGYDMNSYNIQWQLTGYKHIGVNGRMTYAYQQKYIGELSFGYYGSNGYKEGNRFGLFPGISLGWIVSNEDFLKGNNTLDFLKLRASYGISGNNYLDPSMRFMYDQYYSSQGSYIFGTQQLTGWGEHLTGNPNLTWEKKKEFNFGFDATLMKYVNVSVDVFKQERYDILAEPLNVVPQFSGIYSSNLNIGRVDNKGFELQIGYQSRRTGNLNFFADLNLWYARNTITSIPEIIRENEYEQKQGKRINQPFLLESIGYFRDGADIANSPVQIFDVVQEGDLKYKDQNNDNVVDERDFHPSGYTAIPELTLGLNAGVKYKSLYLNLFFHAVTNRSVYLSGNDFYAFQNNGKISKIALDRWTADTHASAKYPRLSSKENMNNFQGSSFWQRDGSFVKLRNIEIGYGLPRALIGKLGIKEATIFINGTNVFTLDHVKIADPEILGRYPATRAFSIGAKIQL